uniref:PIPK domain-containing protein n=1 Tax=Petromyzon marinus TaxID=7757 RepID=S4R4C2_PETMA
GPEQPWFLRQLELDTAFLRGLSVLDYSLLLASQDLHSDEQMQNHSFANLIIRTKRNLDKSVSVETFARQNRRLLPACRNALHVLDGPCTRYYVGIIDIFTVFSVRKRLEAAWKSVRHCGTSFSTVSPDHYAARLGAWARSHAE